MRTARPSPLASKAAPHELPQSNRLAVRCLTLVAESKNFKKSDHTFWKAVNFAQTRSSSLLERAVGTFSPAVVKFRAGRRRKRTVSMVRTINQFT